MADAAPQPQCQASQNKGFKIIETPRYKSTKVFSKPKDNVVPDTTAVLRQRGRPCAPLVASA